MQILNISSMVRPAKQFTSSTYPLLTLESMVCAYDVTAITYTVELVIYDGIVQEQLKADYSITDIGYFNQNVQVYPDVESLGIGYSIDAIQMLSAMVQYVPKVESLNCGLSITAIKMDKSLVVHNPQKPENLSCSLSITNIIYNTGG